MAELKKVLIVDNDKVSLRLIEALIDNLGWETSCVKDAAAAEKIQESDPHHVIISDVQMPGMAEFELLQKFRNRWPKTPFVVFTQKDDDSVAMKAWQNGAFDFLSKPINLDSLRETLKMAVSADVLDAPKSSQDNPYMIQESQPSLSELTMEMMNVIGVEAFIEIVESFKEQAGEDLKKLYDASDKMDQKEVNYWAHKLAGAASNLGMVEVEQFAKKVEAENIESWSIIQVYLNKLEMYVRAALKEMSGLVEKDLTQWDFKNSSKK